MKIANMDIFMFDDDKDTKHENSLLIDSMTLDKLLIKYEPNMIPYVEIEITTSIPETFTQVQNLYVKVNMAKSNREFHIGIIDFFNKPGNKVELHGYLCKHDKIFNISSSYLGSSFIDCVRALDIKKNLCINGKDGYEKTFADNFPFSYWKIQESDMQAAVKILQQAAKNSVFSMSDDTIHINTIDFGNSTATYDFMGPDELQYINKSSFIQNYQNSITLYDDGEKSGLSEYTSLGKFIINTPNSEASLHYTSSLPVSTYLGDTLIKVLYKNFDLPILIGDSMKKSDTIIQTNTNWYVISRIDRITFDKGYETSILYTCDTKL